MVLSVAASSRSMEHLPSTHTHTQTVDLSSFKTKAQGLKEA